jgi:hypothetical protein
MVAYIYIYYYIYTYYQCEQYYINPSLHCTFLILSLVFSTCTHRQFK